MTFNILSISAISDKSEKVSFKLRQSQPFLNAYPYKHLILDAISSSCNFHSLSVFPRTFENLLCFYYLGLYPRCKGECCYGSEPVSSIVSWWNAQPLFLILTTAQMLGALVEAFWLDGTQSFLDVSILLLRLSCRAIIELYDAVACWTVCLAYPTCAVESYW